MLVRYQHVPFVIVLLTIAALSMLIPAVHAYVVRDLETARSFFYSSLLFLTLSGILGITTSNIRVRRQGRGQLIALLSFFAVLPLALALPFWESVPSTTYWNAYVEMVSSLTTTGMTLFPPDRLPDSVHLWRALVGWGGGFFVWVTAIALLAPLNLGGFEVSSPAEIGQGARVGTSQIDRVANPAERLRRFTVDLAPIYGGLTVVLWTALLLAGDTPLVAASHAMSTMATSGISPVGGVGQSSSGVMGEALILCFLVFGLSRVTFSSDERADGWRTLQRDPELRLGLLFVCVLPLLLFARHWGAAFDDDSEVTLLEGLSGLWGGAFTVASFLTTTGWESTSWGAARAWSGLETPGLLLMGLALFGGGVATTAGGVKLLRVFALYKHGTREMEKLVLPSSIGGAGQVARRFRRQGAYVAWIFFMLFAMSIAIVTTSLSLMGLDFETSLILTFSALSTTGPLVSVAGEAPILVGSLPAGAKAILSIAMIVGRLEALAIIALMNPEFWR